jgi:DNA mismatch repair ATPase MutL
MTCCKKSAKHIKPYNVSLLIQVDIDPSLLKVTVSDNGTGIPFECFDALATHHASSKLQSAQDLRQGVHTLGFR